MSRMAALALLAAVLAADAGCTRRSRQGASGTKAQTLYLAGDYRAALGEVQQALASKRGTPALHLLAGKCHEKLGSQTEAIAHYGQARTGDPRLTEAYLREARLHARSGRSEQALSTLRSAEDLNAGMGAADQFQIRALEGEVHLDDQDFDMARRALLDAVELAKPAGLQDDMAHGVVQYNLSRTLLQSGAFRTAHAAFQEYLDIVKRSGLAVEGRDLYTDLVLRLLKGDVRGARELAPQLPEEFRPQAEALLAGDVVSVRELFQKPRERR